MESKHSKKRLNCTERIKKAWAMRLKGMRLQEIGDQLGVTKAQISQDLNKAFTEYKEELKDEAVNYARLDLARVETLLESIWEKAQSGDQKAIATALKILERRAKLLGLDSPIKQQLEVTNKDLPTLQQDLLQRITDGKSDNPTT